MKNLFKKRTAVVSAFVLIAAFAFEGQSVYAQVKIGDNPQTINPGSALEIESTSKGLQLPRVNLNITNVWGLDGTPTRGMQVYNMNGNIFGTPDHPIINQGSGVYYWDGNGWVGTKAFQADATAGDYDWLKTEGGVFPSDPADISEGIFHGGAGNQVVEIRSTDNLPDRSASLDLRTNSTSPTPVRARISTKVNESNVGSFRIESLSGHPMIFGMGPNNVIGETEVAESMRILGNGNVGIGTRTPSNVLHVQSGISVSELGDFNSSNKTIKMGGGGIELMDTGTGGGFFNGFLAFKNSLQDKFDARMYYLDNFGTNGALVLSVSTDGGTTASDALTILNSNSNVGIGTTNPNFKLDVVGDINASGEVRNSGVALTSDERLKTDIEPVTNGLELVSKLKPVSYKKKESIASHDYKRSEIGFIAQEVQKILPQLIREGKDADKTLAMDYISLIPVLTRAIQEQQIQIEKLLTDRNMPSAEPTEIKAMLKMSAKEGGRRASK